MQTGKESRPVTPKKVAGRWVVITVDGERNDFQSHAEAWRWIEQHEHQPISSKMRTEDSPNNPDDGK
jgi:hypothetical protein